MPSNKLLRQFNILELMQSITSRSELVGDKPSLLCPEVFQLPLHFLELRLVAVEGSYDRQGALDDGPVPLHLCLPRLEVETHLLQSHPSRQLLHVLAHPTFLPPLALDLALELAAGGTEGLPLLLQVLLRGEGLRLDGVAVLLPEEVVFPPGLQEPGLGFCQVLLPEEDEPAEAGNFGKRGEKGVFLQLLLSQEGGVQLLGGEVDQLGAVLPFLLPAVQPKESCLFLEGGDSLVFELGGYEEAQAGELILGDLVVGVQLLNFPESPPLLGGGLLVAAVELGVLAGGGEHSLNGGAEGGVLVEGVLQLLQLLQGPLQGQLLLLQPQLFLTQSIQAAVGLFQLFLQS